MWGASTHMFGKWGTHVQGYQHTCSVESTHMLSSGIPAYMFSGEEYKYTHV